MGIEVVKLTGENAPGGLKPAPADLAQPTFKTFTVPSPAMSIWMMTVSPGTPLFPWWDYTGAIDDDLNALKESWNIPSAQGLLDCLTLSHLSKFGGNHLFAIFPGCIKTSGWGGLRPADRETFTRGQGCNYHLFGAFDKKIAINWVPFWQPQSLVRNPNFNSTWRLFMSNTGDEATRCLTLFSLSNPRKLPEIANLLITKDDKRSEKLVSLVDWFAVYSSPLDPKLGTCALLYTKNSDVIAKLPYVQSLLSAQVAEAQKELVKEAMPRTALRIMSRQAAL